MDTRTVTFSSSSQIDTVEYHFTDLNMVITFKNGSQYLYKNVSRHYFANLIAAPSPGSFWNKHKGEFEYVKLEG